MRFRDFAMLISSWYFDIIKCLLIYLSFASHGDILILSWYFDTSKYQINCEILRIWDVDISIILFWYYPVIVDISFVCHLTVIFWYYHDILISQNIKLTLRFCWYYRISQWYFDIIMIFWYIKISNELWDFVDTIIIFDIRTIIITNVCCLDL